MSKIGSKHSRTTMRININIGQSGDTKTLASGASQSGFGRTGTVDWDTTAKTSKFYRQCSGDGYFVNTTSSAIS